MKAWKVCIDDHILPGPVECYSAIFSDKVSAFRYACDFESDNYVVVRIFPVLIKVKYEWSEGYEDK